MTTTAAFAYSPDIIPANAEGATPREAYEAAMIATSLAATGTALANYTTAQAVDTLANYSYWKAAYATGYPTITYSFPVVDNDPATPDEPADYIGNGRYGTLRTFSAAQADAARLAVEIWDDFIPLNFVDAGTDANADMRFFNSTLINTAGGAPAGLGTDGDVWIYNYDQNPPDTRDWSVGNFYFGYWMLHEVGHTLGLSHSGSYPGSGYNGLNYLQESSVYTVMSYNSNSDAEVIWAADMGTPMVNDIAAVQFYYGADTTTRTGDTVYGFNSNVLGRLPYDFDAMLVQEGEIAPITIWDAGGKDTLDVSEFSNSAHIDLIEGGYSNAGGQQMVIGIAYGAVIENAIGGTGHDTIWGNGAGNHLTGAAGKDTLIGAAGDDKLDGDGSSPLGAHGTVFGLALNPAGTSGQSLKVTSATGLPQTATTIVFDLNFATSPAYQWLASIPGISFLIDPTNTGAPGIWVNLNGSWAWSNIRVATLGDGNTHQISFTWDSSTGKYAFYLDGTNTQQGSGLATGAALSATGTGNVTFNPIGGSIGDIRVYDHALSPSDVYAGSYGPLADPANATGLVLNWQVQADGSVIDAAHGHNPTLTGTPATTTLLSATQYDDILDGGTGDDTLWGGAGNDILSGGDGLDTAVYSGVRDGYLVTLNADGSVSIADQSAPAPDATDLLSSIEILQFSDVAVAMADVLNKAPTAVTVTPVTASMTENVSSASHIKVGDIIVADDVFGTNTLSLTGADQTAFEIVGTELFLKAGTALDFEMKSSYQVAVQVDDAALGSTPDATSSTFTLSITDVNEAPNSVVLTNTLASLSERASTTDRIKVATIDVADDALGTNVLSLTGADAASFEIAGTDLYLKAGTKLDFESKATYQVAVQAGDATLGASPDTASTIFTLNISNASPESLLGTAAADRLAGSSDADRIFGLGGNDILSGLAGRDVLVGGSGRDILWGGSGGDVFDFNTIRESGSLAATRDIIRDFTHSSDSALTDIIDVSTMDANGVRAGNGTFQFRAAKGAAFTGIRGELRWYQFDSANNAADRTIIEGDINGDRRADFQIELTGLKQLVAGDFVL